ncbi:Sapep family Mn(2+)-dependent dipeptidase [Oceanobacillus neutriphilus]|uniref:Peptidase n=1 Tax=Oceanobacillus neutriphilus TaxID=531815 RepID=A0ABQ2NR96_9BACI|nr:Sapep family Mn(2+)-dependent dipeptidase [Oceanobacillus neutriphilus]GGP07713.1 peptidase [Oceanobacillus neutriphilus]
MNNYIRLYQEKLQFYEEQLMEDLADLVAIRSVRDEETKQPGAPFGKDIRNIFDRMAAISERDDFKSSDFDGYAMHVEHGDGKEIIGILAHLDIVPEGEKKDWLFDPFTLTRHGEYLYGRGVNDDKAPALAAYYALKILRDLDFEFNRKVRIILGGAEETTWECMDHYFKHNTQPMMAFSPDGDFPIVHGEKGVLQGTFFQQIDSAAAAYPHNLIEIESEKQRGFICERLRVIFESTYPMELKDLLESAEETVIAGSYVIAFYKGDKALSRNPHKGENALFRFSKDLIAMENANGSLLKLRKLLMNYFFNDIHGKKLGLFSEDSEMGVTTFSIPYLLFQNNKLEIGFDYRYPKGQTMEKAKKKLDIFCEKNKLNFTIYKAFNPLYIQQESQLIQTLQRAYKNITGNTPECITKGGISYSRALQNCVAFGPTFPGDIPNTHKPNERIKLQTLHKAIMIYCETVRLLATKS